MSEYLSPEAFKQLLKTDPVFFLDFIYENQPEIVTSNLNEKGYLVESEEEAIATLHELREQGKLQILHNLIKDITIDFERVNEIYHAPLVEALNLK